MHKVFEDRGLGIRYQVFEGYSLDCFAFVQARLDKQAQENCDLFNGNGDPFTYTIQPPFPIGFCEYQEPEE